MRPASPADRPDLELTVNGELGPVLRTALLPHLAAQTQHCTVVRLLSPPEVDLPALVETLESLGLQLASVRCIDRQH
jgi:hypothetical protein